MLLEVKTVVSYTSMNAKQHNWNCIPCDVKEKQPEVLSESG